MFKSPYCSKISLRLAPSRTDHSVWGLPWFHRSYVSPPLWIREKQLNFWFCFLLLWYTIAKYAIRQEEIKGFETFSYCCPKHPFFFSDFSAVSSVICEQIRKLSKTESFLICCIVFSTLLLSSRGQPSAASESWTEQQKAHPLPFVQTAPSMSGLHLSLIHIWRCRR